MFGNDKNENEISNLSDSKNEKQVSYLIDN